jgi:hypothetical protein
MPLVGARAPVGGAQIGASPSTGGDSQSGPQAGGVQDSQARSGTRSDGGRFSNGQSSGQRSDDRTSGQRQQSACPTDPKAGTRTKCWARTISPRLSVALRPGRTNAAIPLPGRRRRFLAICESRLGPGFPCTLSATFPPRPRLTRVSHRTIEPSLDTSFLAVVPGNERKQLRVEPTHKPKRTRAGKSRIPVFGIETYASIFFPRPPRAYHTAHRLRSRPHRGHITYDRIALNYNSITFTFL